MDRQQSQTTTTLQYPNSGRGKGCREHAIMLEEHLKIMISSPPVIYNINNIQLMNTNHYGNNMQICFTVT